MSRGQGSGGRRPGLGAGTVRSAKRRNVLSALLGERMASEVFRTFQLEPAPLPKVRVTCAGCRSRELSCERCYARELELFGYAERRLARALGRGA